MEKEKKTVQEWIKEHKTELIIAGVGLLSIGGALFYFKGPHGIKLGKQIKHVADISPAIKPQIANEMVHAEKAVLTEIIKTRAPHEVAGHVRNLAKGCKPSINKLEQATKLGITLLPSQTLVDGYTTGGYGA